MQINRLVLENFKQYKEQTLDFPEGLIGFVGKNGAGKSSVFDAIMFGLYGLNKSNVKNDRAGSNETVSVEVEFSEKGKKYKVIRKLKGKNLTASADIYCEDVLLATQVKPVNKEVYKILKIDSANFRKSFFSEQNEVRVFLDTNAKDRNKQLRKMLGLEKLDKLGDKINIKRLETDNLVKAKAGILMSEDELQKLGSEIETYTVDYKKFTEERDKLREEYKKANDIYKLKKVERDEQDKIKSEYEKILSTIKVIETKIEQERSSKAKNETELKLLNDKIPEQKRLEEQKCEYEKVTVKVNELKELKVRFEKVKNLRRNIEELLLEIKDKEKSIKTDKEKHSKEAQVEQLLVVEKEKLQLLKDLLNDKQKIREHILEKKSAKNSFIKDCENRLSKIIKLGKNSVCPECSRELNDHYDTLVNKYNTDIAETQRELLVIEKELSEADSNIKIKNEELEKQNLAIREFEIRLANNAKLAKDIEKAEQELNQKDLRLKNFESELKSLGEVTFEEKLLTDEVERQKKLEPFFQEYIKITEQIKRIPIVEREILLTVKQIAELEESSAKQKKEAANINFNYEKFENLKKEVDEKEVVKEKIKEEGAVKNNELTRLESELKNKRETIETNKKRIMEFEEIKKKSEFFGNLKEFIENFKSKITSVELPAITEKASHLFSKITHGRYSNIQIATDDYISVDRDGLSVDLNTLSGGEKDLACLCIRIAISTRIAALAGRNNMGFLALDEVFGSQDEGRREELLNALHTISKDFRQIFVISHNQDVQEEFPARLLIRKDGLYSKAEFVI